MTIFKTVGHAALVSFFVSCATQHFAGALPMTNIAKGAFSGITEARQEVIRDKAAWEKLWNQHNVTTKQGGRIPEIDFAKEMVIAVTLGRKRTGGYAIEILSVAAEDKKLKVTVKRTAPAPGAMVTQALTAPFHFVAVPRSDLNQEFVEVKAADKK